jgi:hypothetical protein
LRQTDEGLLLCIAHRLIEVFTSISEELSNASRPATGYLATRAGEEYGTTYLCGQANSCLMIAKQAGRVNSDLGRFRYSLIASMPNYARSSNWSHRCITDQVAELIALINEIDKADVDFPNNLLNILQDGGFGKPDRRRHNDCHGLV